MKQENKTYTVIGILPDSLEVIVQHYSGSLYVVAKKFFSKDPDALVVSIIKGKHVDIVPQLLPWEEHAFDKEEFEERVRTGRAKWK